MPVRDPRTARTWASRRCFLEMRWFFGFTASLCLAALLSRRAMARGMASRLTLSMVPAGDKCLLGRDGFTGAIYSTDCEKDALWNFLHMHLQGVCGSPQHQPTPACLPASLPQAQWMR